MRNRPCGVAEETWIDWHTGKLEPEEMALLRRHRETCPACAACSRQWEALLGVRGGAGGSAPAARGGTARPDGAAARAADAAREEALRADGAERTFVLTPGGGRGLDAGGPRHRAAKRFPRPRRKAAGRRTKRRLHAAVVWHGLRRRAAAKLRAALQRPGWLAVAGAGFALLLFAGLMAANRIGGDPAGSVSPKRYAELHEPEGAAVMSRPDTVVYKLGGSSPSLSGGPAPDTEETVWVNVRTHEVFVLLEGMLPSDSLDVQAWAQYDGGSANLGLLQFHRNQAHLYTRNVRPELWQALALTIEPKGGSRTPTSPQTASIRLNPQP